MARERLVYLAGSMGGERHDLNLTAKQIARGKACFPLLVRGGGEGMRRGTPEENRKGRPSDGWFPLSRNPRQKRFPDGAVHCAREATVGGQHAQPGVQKAGHVSGVNVPSLQARQTSTARIPLKKVGLPEPLFTLSMKLSIQDLQHSPLPSGPHIRLTGQVLTTTQSAKGKPKAQRKSKLYFLPLNLSSPKA